MEDDPNKFLQLRPLAPPKLVKRKGEKEKKERREGKGGRPAGGTATQRSRRCALNHDGQRLEKVLRRVEDRLEGIGVERLNQDNRGHAR